jgi:thioredoxin reductase (NADPH)
MGEKRHTKVLIIGSGPCGLTAALYASRASLEPIVVEGIKAGGQLMITTDVENYPGFPDGIMGPEVIEKFRAQAERFGTEFVYGDVTRVHTDVRPFVLELDDDPDDVITADTIIIATGADAKWLGIEDEQRLMGYGVSACATCDGAFFKDQEICIVGGGDTAMEEALFLTRYATRVHLVHRRDYFRASSIMLDRAKAHPKIEWHLHKHVVGLEGSKENGVTSITLEDVRDERRETHPWTALFVAIGHKPNSDLWKGLLPMNEAGYLLHKPDSTYSEIPGIFVAGDVADHVYRQAVTAAGSGCMAAIDAERWLEAQGA